MYGIDYRYIGSISDLFRLDYTGLMGPWLTSTNNIIIMYHTNVYRVSFCLYVDFTF